jgi:protein TonB
MPRRLFEQLVVSAGRPRTVRAAAALPFSLVAHVIAVAGALSVPAILSQAVPEPVATPAARPFWPRVVVLKPPVRPTEAVVRRSASQTQHPFRASSAPTTPAWADAMPILTRTDSVLDETLPDERGGLCFDEGCASGSRDGVQDGDPGPLDGASGAGGPIRIKGELQQPAKLRHVNPVYPDLAQRAGVEGRVQIECVIDPSGRVADLRVVKGHPLLDRAAVEAVRQWVYSPTLLNRVPVSVILTVTVDFRIRR